LFVIIIIIIIIIIIAAAAIFCPWLLTLKANLPILPLPSSIHSPSPPHHHQLITINHHHHYYNHRNLLPASNHIRTNNTIANIIRLSIGSP